MDFTDMVTPGLARLTLLPADGDPRRGEVLWSPDTALHVLMESGQQGRNLRGSSSPVAKVSFARGNTAAIRAAETHSSGPAQPQITDGVGRLVLPEQLPARTSDSATFALDMWVTLADGRSVRWTMPRLVPTRRRGEWVASPNPAWPEDDVPPGFSGSTFWWRDITPGELAELEGTRRLNPTQRRALPATVEMP